MCKKTSRFHDWCVYNKWLFRVISTQKPWYVWNIDPLILCIWNHWTELNIFKLLINSWMISESAVEVCTMLLSHMSVVLKILITKTISFQYFKYAQRLLFIQVVVHITGSRLKFETKIMWLQKYLFFNKNQTLNNHFTLKPQVIN